MTDETQEGKVRKLPLHTNRFHAAKKAGLEKPLNKRERAIETGDPQAVIDALSEKQRRFVEEYLVDLDSAAACLRAGYKTANPKQMGYQIKNVPAVRIAIDAMQAERNKNSDITKDFVLKKIVRLLDKSESADNYNAALRAAELLARHLGMFIERTEISGPDGDAIKVQKTQEDADAFTRGILDLANRK